MANARHHLSLSFVCVLAAFAVAGCGHDAGSTKPKEAPWVTVAHPVARDLMDEDDYNGWLTAHDTLEVRLRVRGHIQAIHFKDGDIVRKGQLLFELDPRPFQVEIDQALANAKALEAQKVAVEKDVVRYTELLKSGGASRQQLEKAQADAQAYDAQIAAKMEEVKRFELDLQYSKITADLGGKISKANLSEGNLVNAGGSDPLLTTIVSIDPIYVDFNVDERAMQHYQEIERRPAGQGQATIPPRSRRCHSTFGLDTEKGFPHEGHLVFADNKYRGGHRHDPRPRRRQQPRRPAYTRLARPRPRPRKRQVPGNPGSRHGGEHRPGPEIPAPCRRGQRRHSGGTFASAACSTTGCESSWSLS